ncbi:MAG: transglycosylase domain-containing protein [Opitutaceae bacterium]|nr:transglycosylase domain-containing protein [Cytophagales bacterium]
MEKFKNIAGIVYNSVLSILQFLFVRPIIWFKSLPLKRKILFGFGAAFAFILLLITGPIILYYSVTSGMFGKMPDNTELQEIKKYQASEVYSSDSILLGRYFVENRSEAKYEEVNKVVFDAIIATEDARFYEHTGVDTRSLIRVLFKSVLLGKNSGGGSTLSQQLAKNLFGRKNYGLLTMPVNKIKEAIIANQLEKLYSKQEILMLYVNTISFGEDTYGIKTATQRFFNVTPDKIKPEQAAVLAGLLKSPSAYNPRKRPERALERRNLVIQQMLKYNYIDKTLADELTAKPLVLNYHRMDNNDGLAPHFREKLRQELEEWLEAHPGKDGKKYNLSTDGLKIYTTLNARLQYYAEIAASSHLKRMQPYLLNDIRSQGYFRRNNKLIVDGLKNSSRYKLLEDNGLSQSEIIKELKKPLKLLMFTQNGEKEMEISPFDSVRLMMSNLQVGMLVVNPRSGNILAWVGSPDYKYFQYDHVTSQRQVGSVFKPIVYAKALQDGTDPCEFISNQKITYTQYENWTPQNSEDTYEGKYSVAGALANSINTISVQLCMRSGINQVISLARSMGIKSDLPPKPSIALGTADLTLYELIGAYTVFASGGTRTDLQMVTSIKNQKGQELHKVKKTQNRVLDSEVSRHMTNMMRNVINKGTAYELREKFGFKGDMAGKTGTTQDHRDAWFVGYTPNCLAGVWVGADNPGIHFSSMELGKGSRLAMPVWAKFFSKGLNDPKTRRLVGGSFPYPLDAECEMKKEDGFFAKMFRRREKQSDISGTGGEVKPKRKRFRLFGKRQDN